MRKGVHAMLPPKKVTMSDIAEKLGVSKNAVSLALNNRPGVSEKLRQEIVNTAIQMNYHNFAFASRSQNNCIVALVPEYIQKDTFFYSEIFWSVEKEVTQQGFTFVTVGIFKKDELSLTPPALPGDLPIVGMLTIGIFSDAYVEMLYQMGIPMISVDISYHQLPVSSIGSSNLSGGYAATDYLIRAGHQRIGFVGTIYTAQSVYERWCGFQQAMGHNDLAVHPEYCILGGNGRFQLFDTTDALLPYFEQMPSLPTAFFCAGDRVAYAVYNILAEKKLRVPRDVSVIGFDDLDYSKVSVPPLTTIHVDRKLMGKMAVRNLLDLCRTGSDSTPCHVSLPVQLIERASVQSFK